MIKFNNKTISSIYSGEKGIDKIMKGTLLVYGGWKTLIASGVPPLVLTKCKGVDLVDYKIYGNSVQEGTPTPETPIEIESVGDKTKNLIQIESFKPYEANGVTVTNNNDGTVTINGIPTGYVGTNITGNLPNETLEILRNNICTFSGNYDNKQNVALSLIFNLNNTTVKQFAIHRYTQNNYMNIDVRDIEFDRALVNIKRYSDNIEIPNVVVKPQLEIGTIPTEFEKYGYKIPVKATNEARESVTTNIYLDEPLRKIGDISDYIDFESQKVVRKIYKQQILSTFNWKDYGTSIVNTHNFNYKGIEKYELIANRGVAKASQIGFSNLNFNRISLSYEYFGLASGDLDGMIAKLEEYENSGEPLTIYYSTNEIPEKTIELPNIPTHKGTTILEIDTEIQPSNMEVVYKGKK